ncbi:hypothetical protein Hypma_015386 [Hypsizygus marmoreus]|uniref:Uncharacterized protein n=1 Tax=Hypsizygus marmoreus TaxID=39966 RepID=A0A369K7S2_HYPMA|nr:hypothetical protein Hypma_015386 [Hypsizygus marmoreus]
MASLRLQPHRRRSQSASTSSPIPQTPILSSRAATKRTHPHHSCSPKDVSSLQKWDVDVWRRGKRRRINTLPALEFDIPPSALGDRYSSTAPPTPSFATTSAEFSLYPKREQDSARLRGHTQPQDSSCMEVTDSATCDTTSLSHLRSNAFGELRRSVAENGEGLVQRMRDYEHSRSRSDVYTKVKEARRRGRKRSSLFMPSRRLAPSSHESDADGDGEDDIQIFAGDIPRISLSGNSGQKARALSLDMMDEDPRDYGFPTFIGSQPSSPGATCDSASSKYRSDDDDFDESGVTSPLTTQSLFSSSPPNAFLPAAAVPSLPESPNSSLVSLILPSPSLFPSPSTPHQTSHAHSSSTRSEKAIAALSLAMANGAGGISDYGDLLAMKTTPMEGCQVGELWH